VLLCIFETSWDNLKAAGSLRIRPYFGKVQEGIESVCSKEAYLVTEGRASQNFDDLEGAFWQHIYRGRDESGPSQETVEVS
jgi:hypothetical protein